MNTPSPSAGASPGVSIVDTNALIGALRTLKLGGMLQTLDARLAQAHAGDLGHLEFLQVLCLDEISRRETTAIARRTRRARFEQTATLEGFDFTANPKLPAAQVRDLAALRWLRAGESVILHGPVGVGKTHIAQALAHLAIRAGAEARFAKTSRVLAGLAEAESSLALAREAAASSIFPSRARTWASTRSGSGDLGACAAAFRRILTASSSLPFASWASAFVTASSSFLSARAGAATPPTTSAATARHSRMCTSGGECTGAAAGTG